MMKLRIVTSELARTLNDDIKKIKNRIRERAWRIVNPFFSHSNLSPDFVFFIVI